MIPPEAWYPGIARACEHWRDARMLAHTYEALQQNFLAESDASIDCAKCIVEVVCRIIVDEFHTDNEPFRPRTASPSLGEWLAAAVRALKLTDVRHGEFQKLISAHNKLADALNALRNAAGPVSHGKQGYIERLTAHHRRMAVLSADAVVTFLHQAFAEASPNLVLTREPYERFADSNALIDEYVGLDAAGDDEGGLILTVRLPNGDEYPLVVEPSRLLFHLDREIYVAAHAAAAEAETAAPGEEEAA